MTYRIEYSRDAEEHLRVFAKRDQQMLLDEVDRQLMHQPDTPTRNRKRLRPNLLADWELRAGSYRIYYLVREPPSLIVWVIAIGKKRGNRVSIGGIEVKL